MKLWLLRPIENLENDPWNPVYNKMISIVVRAKTESDARNFANEEAGAENEHGNPWLDNKASTCVELKQNGDAGVIIFEFVAA